MIDLMFLVSGQLTGTTTSMIFDAISDPSVLRDGSWWLSMVGFGSDGESKNSGLGALIAGGAVTLGFLISKSDTVLFIPIAAALGLLAADFILIFNTLKVYSPVLAALIMTPIIVAYGLIIAEFARGRD